MGYEIAAHCEKNNATVQVKLCQISAQVLPLCHLKCEKLTSSHIADGFPICLVRPKTDESGKSHTK